MNKAILVIIVVLIVVVGGYFLLKGGYRAPETVVPEEEVLPPTTETPEIKELTVSGTEYNFSPSSITVSAGEKVKITFRNDGSIGHNFVVSDLGVSTRTISPGQTDTVEFTAPSSGTYDFFCSIPGHRPAGMEGSLKVE